MIATLFFVFIIAQMRRVPTNDYFVFKGSIYLLIATFVRVGSCCFLFISFTLYENGKFTIDKKRAFGVYLTQMTLEVPLYLMLITFYSLLFATYKLYLVLQEMIGITNTVAEA